MLTTATPTVGRLIACWLRREGVLGPYNTPVAGPECTQFDQDCPDDRTIYNKQSKVLECEGSNPVPPNVFGGGATLSRRFPLYQHPQNGPMDLRVIGLFMIEMAVRVRGARKGRTGSHGDECGMCKVSGITVAQRIWLTVDGRLEVLSTAKEQMWIEEREWINGEPPLNIYCTYHRRELRDQEERHKTRLIHHDNNLFQQITLDEVMATSDLDLLERYAPDLHQLAA